MRWSWALLLVAACRTGEPAPITPAAPPAPHRSATVIVTSELEGYVGPCGCSENMRGGLARAAAQVSAARQLGPVLYLDLGDAFFGAPSVPEAAVPQQERKAHAIAAALQTMGLGGRLVGPLDDARGESLRTSLGLKELSATAPSVLEVGGIRVGVVPGADPATLSTQAALARAQGADFVLAAWLGAYDDALKALNEGMGIDFAVVARPKDAQAGETNRMSRLPVPMAQPQSKGRSLLKLELRQAATGRYEVLRGAAETERDLAAFDQRIELLRKQVNEPGLDDELKALRKAKLEEVIARREALASSPPPVLEGKNTVSARFVPLESSFPEDPAVKALITAYDREVGELNLAWAREHGQDCAKPGPGVAAYVGSEACRECHEEAFPAWEGSKHHAAMPTLEAVGKQFHLDCVGCHVTGWQQPGGVCRIDQTARLASVGCEACHGPGSFHVDSPSSENVAKGDDPKGCRACHDPENSPHFEFDGYLAHILGPGHGQPAANGVDAGAAPHRSTHAKATPDAGTPAKLKPKPTPSRRKP